MKSALTKRFVFLVIFGCCATLLPRLSAGEPATDTVALKKDLIDTLKVVLSKQHNTLSRIRTASVLLKLDPENTEAAEVLVDEGLFGTKVEPIGARDLAHQQAVQNIREALKTAPPALVKVLIRVLKQPNGFTHTEVIELLSDIDADEL